jgi:hypothetical protein
MENRESRGRKSNKLSLVHPARLAWKSEGSQRLASSNVPLTAFAGRYSVNFQGFVGLFRIRCLNFRVES